VILWYRAYWLWLLGHLRFRFGLLIIGYHDWLLTCHLPPPRIYCYGHHVVFLAKRTICEVKQLFHGERDYLFGIRGIGK
jgi:hypothetical protein